MYRKFFKRFLDVVISFLVLLCLSPLLLLLTVWLHFANRGAGAFFLQERPGRGGKIFKVIKFKTMTDARDATGHLLPDEERITRVGAFVRSTSLDELLQFVNVLKGDMSLIGPRPLLVQYLPLYNATQARRHEVRPGISGWSEKFAYDVWYVDHLSFLTDCKVVALTIKSVLKRDGIAHEGSATMEPFNGHN